jgi:hypothetical protein
MFHDGGPPSINRVSEGKSLLHRNDIDRSTPTKKAAASAAARFRPKPQSG